MISVALLDENTGRRTELARLLTKSGKYRVITSLSPEVVAEQHSAGSVDAVILLHDESGQDGLLLLTTLKNRDAELPVIFITDNYQHRVATETLLHHSQYLVMPQPVAAECPVLLQLIETAVEERRTRQAVIALKKKLELVGSVTRHDVLNQLTAVMGYNELLLIMIEDPTQKIYLEREKIAADRIRVQFQFARDCQNIGVEPPRWQMIRSVVHRAGELFDLKTIRVVETCGDATVFADPIFDMAISYLLDNAIHYGGNVTEIHVFLEDAAHEVVLVFADNGEGIPAANKEKVFTRGFGKNTGWGLFLVREILAVTKITIAETGEPGKGARFEMHIPAGIFRRERESSGLITLTEHNDYT